MFNYRYLDLTEQKVFDEKRAGLVALVGQQQARATALDLAAQRAADEAAALAVEGTRALEMARQGFGRVVATLQRRQAAVEAEVVL